MIEQQHRSHRQQGDVFSIAAVQLSFCKRHRSIHAPE
jgi:hypothetical protein